MYEADFIVIGSGSAGSVIASRLSEDPKTSVLVLECGVSDFGPFIQMPAALSYPMNMRRYDWGFATEPEPGLGGRKLACPRGKVVGGSSSINGMVYVRGHAMDFDGWEALGAAGWAYRDVLPYFMRMEAWHGADGGGDRSWRGSGGPLHVTRGKLDNPLFSSFESAGEQAGFETTPDYNGEKQEGFGPFDRTIWKGRRWSTANAYLKPALRRSNADLLRGFARRVLIEEGRAAGVEIERGGAKEVVRARREVIVSASSINSPKLLMLSGIGPGSHLQEFGIEVVSDRRGVGANLQDHLEVYMQQACKLPITLHKYWNLAGRARTAVQWLLFGSGPGASNHFESGAFIRSRPGVQYPDIQIHFLPIAVSYDGKSAAGGHGYQAHVGPMRSKSRGRVALKSANPEESPSIRFNYMSNEDDWRDFRHGIRVVREVFAQRAMDPYRGEEISPGSGCRSDEELDDFIRNHAESAYHPCGTCRMGAADDDLAVVDPACKVIGVEGLRVADSSIFPCITYGNLNAPSILVGEKASDHILGKPALPPDDRQPWINPRWEESDR